MSAVIPKQPDYVESRVTLCKILGVFVQFTEFTGSCTAMWPTAKHYTQPRGLSAILSRHVLILSVYVMLMKSNLRKIYEIYKVTQFYDAWLCILCTVVVDKL